MEPVARKPCIDNHGPYKYAFVIGRPLPVLSRQEVVVHGLTEKEISHLAKHFKIQTAPQYFNKAYQIFEETTNVLTVLSVSLGYNVVSSAYMGDSQKITFTLAKR